MKRRFAFLVGASFGALFALAGFSGAPEARAAFYKYVDKNGVVIFTDRLESIPPQYRNQIKEYKERKPPQTPPAQPQEASQGPAAGEAAPKPAEEERKAQEAKALEEKALQEEKARARKEKEKQIAELQDRIRAKQQEQRNLRTNWMVYDRIRLNQLNEEIAGLGRQVLTLQKELSE